MQVNMKQYRDGRDWAYESCKSQAARKCTMRKASKDRRQADAKPKRVIVDAAIKRQTIPWHNLKTRINTPLQEEVASNYARARAMQPPDVGKNDIANLDKKCRRCRTPATPIGTPTTKEKMEPPNRRRIPVHNVAIGTRCSTRSLVKTERKGEG